MLQQAQAFVATEHTQIYNMQGEWKKQQKEDKPGWKAPYNDRKRSKRKKQLSRASYRMLLIFTTMH